MTPTDTATPPSLADRYTLRAALAFRLEHDSHTPAQLQALHTAYAALQAALVTLEAQWGRQEAAPTSSTGAAPGP